MIIIEDTLVSEDIFEKKFVCHIEKCKGICCIEGDAGAPLLDEEMTIITEELSTFLPYMDQEGKKLVSEKGVWETDKDGDVVSTCKSDGACAFAAFENGSYQCSIEKAFEDSKTDFRKPISCHLYPIRLSKVGDYTALNYHSWDICSTACERGEALGIPIYKFLKEPLQRAFGEDWYRELESIGSAYLENES